MATRLQCLTAQPDDASPAKPALAHILLSQVLHDSPPRLTAHHARVGTMSETLARRLGLGETDALAIGRSGTLHDIGMALLPRDLLDHDGPLSMNEKELMHRHSAWAHEILDLSGDPGLKLAAQVALEHHERWDGSGYPFGLAGEEICLAARIVAVCAVYDALRHPRPGKPPLGHEAAVAVLCDGDDQSHADAFDPAVRETFMRFEDDFRHIVEGGSSLSKAA